MAVQGEMEAMADCPVAGNSGPGNGQCKATSGLKSIEGDSLRTRRGEVCNAKFRAGMSGHFSSVPPCQGQQANASCDQTGHASPDDGTRNHRREVYGTNCVDIWH
jgi:hypothetical protein